MSIRRAFFFLMAAVVVYFVILAVMHVVEVNRAKAVVENADMQLDKMGRELAVKNEQARQEKR